MKGCITTLKGTNERPLIQIKELKAQMKIGKRNSEWDVKNEYMKLLGYMYIRAWKP